MHDILPQLANILSYRINLQYCYSVFNLKGIYLKQNFNTFRKVSCNASPL